MAQEGCSDGLKVVILLYGLGHTQTLNIMEKKVFLINTVSHKCLKLKKKAWKLELK